MWARVTVVENVNSLGLSIKTLFAGDQSGKNSTEDYNTNILGPFPRQFRNGR